MIELAAGIGAFLLSVALSPVVARLADQWGLVDEPREHRKSA